MNSEILKYISCLCLERDIHLATKTLVGKYIIGNLKTLSQFLVLLSILEVITSCSTFESIW